MKTNEAKELAKTITKLAKKGYDAELNEGFWKIWEAIINLAQALDWQYSFSKEYILNGKSLDPDKE